VTPSSPCGGNSLTERGSVAWLVLSGILAAGACAGWWVNPENLAWNAELNASQPWRHFTAAWAHLSGAHLVANLAGALVVALFGAAAPCTARDTWAWLAAWPLTHVLLSLQNDLRLYAGLSGVLHAGVVIACMALLTRRRGSARLIGGAVLAGLFVKLLGEDALSAAVQHSPDWGFPVAVLAHASGAAAGLFCAAVAWATSLRAGGATLSNHKSTTET
jgi:rhomboid family GlyGly-CTERM serine protease